MNPRIALFLLAIPAIACGGRSDLVDVPGDVAACSMTLHDGGPTETSITTTLATAEIDDTDAPSILFDCQGVVGENHYALSGRYEPGAAVMHPSWRMNGSPGFGAPWCSVTTELNDGVTTTGEHLRVGEPFFIAFNCSLPSIYGDLDNVHGTLSAPLTAH